MAKTTLARIGVSQWSAGTDLWPGRTGWNTELAAINGNAAKWLQGTTAGRPVASSAGIYYWATDTQRLWYDNGTTWTEVSPVGGGGTPVAEVVGGAGSEGTSRIAARADHVHALAAPATDPGANTFGGAMTRGVSATPARSDHAHATPVIPISTQAGSNLVANVAGTVGTSTNLARADHTHQFPFAVPQVLEDTSLPEYLADFSGGSTAALWAKSYTLPSQFVFWVEVQATCYVHRDGDSAAIAGFLRSRINFTQVRNTRWHSGGGGYMSNPWLAVTSVGRLGPFNGGSVVPVHIDIDVDASSYPVRWSSGALCVSVVRASI